MQKIKKSLAKIVIMAMLIPMLAGIGPGAVSAFAATALQGSVPSAAYIQYHMGCKLFSEPCEIKGTFFPWSETRYYDGTSFVRGEALFYGNWQSIWLSSTDLTRWMLMIGESPPVDAQHVEPFPIPLDYIIVTRGGVRVTRPGTAGAITDEGLLPIPPLPQVTTVNENHVVVAGENLATIARNHGVTVAAIRAANQAYFDDLAARNYRAGTQIQLETGVTLIIPFTTTSGVYYTVQPGDTLWGIAFNYYGTMIGPRVNAIINANSEKFQRTGGILEAGAVIYLPATGIRNPIDTTYLDRAIGIYRVRAGETLNAINTRFYGSGADARGIVFETNKERIRRVGNVHMIYEQQWLVIIR